VRPKSVELVSLLKTGNMDYAWEYLSVAKQHDLKYVTLDDHINLGNYKFDNFYALAQVKVTGKAPGTWITRTGQSCTYGLTLVKTAPNRDGAVLFLEYLLDPEKGLKILEEMGQPAISPSQAISDAVRQGLPGKLPALTGIKQ
jgi:molybdate/tungstate transport system substrate-binding protein